MFCIILLICTLDRVDNDRNNLIFEFRFRRSELGLSGTRRPRATPGLVFGCPVHMLGESSMHKPGENGNVTAQRLEGVPHQRAGLGSK